MKAKKKIDLHDVMRPSLDDIKNFVLHEFRSGDIGVKECFDKANKLFEMQLSGDYRGVNEVILA